MDRTKNFNWIVNKENVLDANKRWISILVEIEMDVYSQFSCILAINWFTLLASDVFTGPHEISVWRYKKKIYSAVPLGSRKQY